MAAGYVLLVMLQMGVTQQTEHRVLVDCLLGAVVPAAITTHWLLWWQVLRGVWALCRNEAPDDWLLAGVVLWWLVLVGFQLLCLACWLSPAAAESGTPWLQF